MRVVTLDDVPGQIQRVFSHQVLESFDNFRLVRAMLFQEDALQEFLVVVLNM